MKKLKLYKKNKSQKSKLSEIFDVVKNANRRACSLLTLLRIINKLPHPQFRTSEYIVIDKCNFHICRYGSNKL